MYWCYVEIGSSSSTIVKWQLLMFQSCSQVVGIPLEKDSYKVIPDKYKSSVKIKSKLELSRWEEIAEDTVFCVIHSQNIIKGNRESTPLDGFSVVNRVEIHEFGLYGAHFVGTDGGEPSMEGSSYWFAP